MLDLKRVYNYITVTSVDSEINNVQKAMLLRMIHGEVAPTASLPIQVVSSYQAHESLL